MRANGIGLRGGDFTIGAGAGGSVVLPLVGVKWVVDVVVDGVVRWVPQSGAVAATLAMVGPGGETGHMSITWNTRVSGALAEVTGIFDRQPIVASLPAP